MALQCAASLKVLRSEFVSSVGEGRLATWQSRGDRCGCRKISLFPEILQIKSKFSETRRHFETLNSNIQKFLGQNSISNNFLSLNDKSMSNRSTRILEKKCNGTVTEAVKETVGSVFGHNLRFAIVVARFNENVTRLLLAGALEAFTRYGVDQHSIQVVWVPGSFEIPVTAQSLAMTKKFDAVVCIGAVIRGATTHYDAVAGAAANGVLQASMKSEVPCIFGILTTENPEQALDRAGGKAGNKGAEAAITAIEMANLMATLKYE